MIDIYGIECRMITMMFDGLIRILKCLMDLGFGQWVCPRRGALGSKKTQPEILARPACHTAGHIHIDIK